MPSSLLNNLLISIITIVGLIVLMAMKVVNSDVGVPLIGTLAGVHIPAPSSAPQAAPPSGPTPAAGGQGQ